MSKIKLTITGCLGKMGQQLIKSSKTVKNFKVVSVTENRIINKKVSEPGMFYGISTSLVIGVPMFAFAKFNGLTDLAVWSSIFTVSASGIIVYYFTNYGSIKKKRN